MPFYNGQRNLDIILLIFFFFVFSVLIANAKPGNMNKSMFSYNLETCVEKENVFF